MIDFNQFPSPCYIMEEELLRKNLCLIKNVADRAGVEIILAFKSFAMWRSFPIFREYIDHSTASSVYEARLRPVNPARGARSGPAYRFYPPRNTNPRAVAFLLWNFSYFCP